MCVVQVALATLWSCFPVSACGADVPLLSLLHTSSGSCSVLRQTMGRCVHLAPPFFLPLHTVPSFPLYIHLSSSLLLALLLFGHILRVGIQGARGKGRGQGLGDAALPQEQEGGRSCRHNLFYVSEDDAATPLTQNLYMLSLCNYWRLAALILKKATLNLATVFDFSFKIC